MQPITISMLCDRTKGKEHYSFWLTEDTMRYIRNASKFTRITQGQILQLIIDYYRLTRKKACGADLTAEEKVQLEAVKYISKIMPL